MMENAFYFMLKAIFVLKIFTFLSWRFGYVEKRLAKKAKISKLMTSYTGQQIIKIHIFPIISRSKGNQAMKFCQVIECKVRNIFLQKS